MIVQLSRKLGQRAARQCASDGGRLLTLSCWPSFCLRPRAEDVKATGAGRAFEESASEPISGTAKVWVIGRREVAASSGGPCSRVAAMTVAGRLRHRLHTGAANNATIRPLLKSTARPFCSVNPVLEHTTAISHCSSLPASQRLAVELRAPLPNHTSVRPPRNIALPSWAIERPHCTHTHRPDFLKACRSPPSNARM